MEALAIAVHHDAEGNAVQPGDDAAVEFGAARIHRHAMALGGIAHRRGAAIQQQL